MDTSQSMVGKAMAIKNVFVSTIEQHQKLVSQSEGMVAPTESSGITVNFRTRPLSELEKSKGYFPVLFCGNSQTTLYYPSFRVLTDASVDAQQFSFDGNFGADASNTDVYREAIQGKLNDVIAKNGILTIMAYGQTGSGKTYTIFNVAEQLVDDLPLFEAQCKAEISIVEIQGNILRDLSVIAMREESSVVPKVFLGEDGAPVYSGVNVLVAETKEEILEIFHAGFASRSTRSTLKNAQSSRSHFVCTIHLVGQGLDVILKLVDLAGSENGSDKREHDAVRLAESIAINKSLMALKDCIRKVSQASAETHVPFRSSKLTMVLKDALDPSLSRPASSVIFALAAPTVADLPHTFNTYRYALALKSFGDSGDNIGNDTVLQHKSVDIPEAMARVRPKKENSTPMAWSRAKLERWVTTQFQNQVELHQLLGPKGDPKSFGIGSREFVLPAWKFLYNMSADDWIKNAGLHAKFKEEQTILKARQAYKQLFVKERATAASTEVSSTANTSRSTSLMLVEPEEPKNPKGLSRAEIAMAKAKAKGAALRAKVNS